MMGDAHGTTPGIGRRACCPKTIEDVLAWLYRLEAEQTRYLLTTLLTDMARDLGRDPDDDEIEWILERNRQAWHDEREEARRVWASLMPERP